MEYHYRGDISMSYRALFARNLIDYKNKFYGPDGALNPSDPALKADWHVLAEGDSWFHFNKLRPQENLLMQLEFARSTVVCNLALSGDNVAQMINPKIPGLFNKSRAKTYKSALELRRWDMILLSACGNDLIDAFVGGYDVGKDKKVKLIKSCENPKDFKDFLNMEDLEVAIKSISQSFAHMIKLIRESGKGKNEKTKIIVHTYDYFTLRDAPKGDKTRRQKALEKHGVPKTYWKQISGLMNDRLAALLLSFNNPSKYPNLHVINTMDTLTPADQDEPGNTRHWRNEIHPNADGYRMIAKERVNQHLFL